MPEADDAANGAKEPDGRLFVLSCKACGPGAASNGPDCFIVKAVVWVKAAELPGADAGRGES